MERQQRTGLYGSKYLGVSYFKKNTYVARVRGTKIVRYGSEKSCAKFFDDEYFKIHRVRPNELRFPDDFKCATGAGFAPHGIRPNAERFPDDKPCRESDIF